jgi:hypothetical protein
MTCAAGASSQPAKATRYNVKHNLHPSLSHSLSPSFSPSLFLYFFFSKSLSRFGDFASQPNNLFASSSTYNKATIKRYTFQT